MLFEPEIPNNTGNIGRTCIGGNSELHLIGPLGFEITDKKLKRAGLDYWVHLKWYQHKNFEEFLKVVDDPSRLVFFETHTEKSVFDYEFKNGDWLIFGKETTGISQELLKKYPDQIVKFPIYGPIRSLNLANTVAAGLYEAIRQVTR